MIGSPAIRLLEGDVGLSVDELCRAYDEIQLARSINEDPRRRLPLDELLDCCVRLIRARAS